MAANPNNEYKVFRYYEGLCTSDDFPKDTCAETTSEQLKDVCNGSCGGINYYSTDILYDRKI